MVGVEQWAEVRRLVLVERRSQRQVAKSLGLARDTVARALVSDAPPRYVRASAGSKLDPFREWICEQLQAEPRIPSQRLRELAIEVGYEGGKTIFDDFVTTKKQGLGLGLALSKKLVEQLGGAIAVTSQVGAGTTFTLRFPITKARPTQLAAV